MKKAKKLADFTFPKFEKLSFHYANKVDFRKIRHIEKDDLIQDLKFKIFNSLIKWFVKNEKYKVGIERFKPIDIKYYVGCACNNLLADLFKDLEESPKQSVSIQHNSFDFGLLIENDDSILDWNEKIIILNGVDLLEGLTGTERNVFFLYLKGFSLTDLRVIYSKYKVDQIISNQKTVLFEKKGQILKKTYQRTFFTFKTDEI